MIKKDKFGVYKRKCQQKCRKYCNGSTPCILRNKFGGLKVLSEKNRKKIKRKSPKAKEKWGLKRTKLMRFKGVEKSKSNMHAMIVVFSLYALGQIKSSPLDLSESYSSFVTITLTLHYNH